MKFAAVASKTLKEIVRDRKGLALLIAFPAIFMLVFGFAFSGGQGENNPYKIGLINKDREVHTSGAASEHPNDKYGKELVETLNNLTFEDSNVPLFHVKEVDHEKGAELLRDREIACTLTIPPNFSESVHQLINSTIRKEVTSQIGEMVITRFVDSSDEVWEKVSPSEFSLPQGGQFLPEDRPPELPKVEAVTAKVVIRGDPGYIAYGRARAILSGILQQFEEEVISRARKETVSHFDGEATSSTSSYISISSETISGTESFSIFDYQAPGILVFAMLVGAIGVATALASEVDKGTLERLKITNMKAFDLLFGTLLPWSLVAITQVLILFATALLVGFNWSGGFSSLGYAVLVAAIGGIASVALGLLIAAFSKNEEHASNLGTLITVPLSFISGAFFPLPDLTVGKLFGYSFQLYDILPWSHASDSLRVLLTFGGTIHDVLVHISFMIVLTALLFLGGIVCFSRNRLSATQ